MNTPSAAIARASLALMIASGPIAAAAAPAAERFLPDGRLAFPADYREWIYLTTGLDMSYSDKPDANMHSMFDSVFVEPAAYQSFVLTGTWPEKTLLVLEHRAAEHQGSINKHGAFQSGEPMGVEVHVKNARFAGGWAFFAFDGTQPAKQIPTTENCYACHQQHAAVDTTFVQFYPTLLPIARQHGTLSPRYQP